MPVDGLGDGEPRQRAPGPALRLHPAAGRLLRLVPRRRPAQEGLPGQRGALSPSPPPHGRRLESTYDSTSTVLILSLSCLRCRRRKTLLL